MEPWLTDERRSFLATARRFAREKIAPHDRRREQEQSIDRTVIRWRVPKTAVDAIDQCRLTHGHYGRSMDVPPPQRLRDVTAQIMSLIIARDRIRAHAG